MLDMNLQRSETVPSGSIRMRMCPAAVTPIIEIASKGGESRITRLACGRPGRAGGRYRTSSSRCCVAQREKLEGFLKSKDLKIDQVITLSKELASVQAFRSSSVNTRARQPAPPDIDTELLTIDFRLPPQAFGAEQTPVRDAASSVRLEPPASDRDGDLLVAMLLPWLILIVPGIVLAAGLLARHHRVGSYAGRPASSSTSTSPAPSGAGTACRPTSRTGAEVSGSAPLG